jgi:hypothetical protein
MPSCLEAGQRAKLNRTCHSAQSSLLTFFQESLKLLFQESGINKKESPKLKLSVQGINEHKKLSGHKKTDIQKMNVCF